MPSGSVTRTTNWTGGASVVVVVVVVVNVAVVVVVVEVVTTGFGAGAVITANCVKCVVVQLIVWFTVSITILPSGVQTPAAVS